MRIPVLPAFLGCAFALNSHAGVFGPPRGFLAAQVNSAGPTVAEASYSCDIVSPNGTGFVSVHLTLPARKLEYRTGGMPGLYGPGRGITKTLPVSDAAEFQRLFASLKFFALPKAAPRAAVKGREFWTVSAEEGGKKHVVTRLEPKADTDQAGLVKACEWLSSAANR